MHQTSAWQRVFCFYTQACKSDRIALLEHHLLCKHVAEWRQNSNEIAHRFVLSRFLSGESCENVWYPCEDVVVTEHVAGSRNNRICCKYIRVQRWPLVAPRSQHLATEAKLGHCAGKSGGRSGKRRVERAIHVSKVKGRPGGEDPRRRVVRLVSSCEISGKNWDGNDNEIDFK